MKYTIDEERMSETAVLSTKEVAMQLLNCNAFEVAADERMGDVCLDEGTLVVDIHHLEPEDPRVDGCVKRREEFNMSDIREHFTAADYYQWAKDEDGDDVLLCFGC